MQFNFGAERLAPELPTETSQTTNDEHHPPPFQFEASGVTPQSKSKRSNSAASGGIVVVSQSVRGQQNKKRRVNTPVAREDPCCSCSVNATCSLRNCPCAKARRPCLNCDPGDQRCSNTIACHNKRIQQANRQSNNTSARRLRGFFGLGDRPALPYIQDPATPAGIFNHADPLDLLNNNATTLFPVTGRSETVNRDPTN